MELEILDGNNWRKEVEEKLKETIGVIVVLYNPKKKIIRYTTWKNYEEADKEMFYFAERNPSFVMCHMFEK